MEAVRWVRPLLQQSQQCAYGRRSRCWMFLADRAAAFTEGRSGPEHESPGREKLKTKVWPWPSLQLSLRCNGEGLPPSGGRRNQGCLLLELMEHLLSLDPLDSCGLWMEGVACWAQEQAGSRALRLTSCLCGFDPFCFGLPAVG